MVYINILLGVGCVVAAAAIAIYYSMPTANPPQRTGQHRRRDNNENNDSVQKINLRNLGKSKPGDKCIVCLNTMTAETMRAMNCGHALHELPCYRDYRNLSRQCPHCFQIAMRIDLPGEDCAICCEPMEAHNMEYLRCEHAIHKICLDTYKHNGFSTCPMCARSL